MDNSFLSASPATPLDGQVKAHLGVSWGDARKLIERGKVFVNDDPWMDGTRRVPPGMTITVRATAPRLDKRALRAPVDLVFSDAHVIVVNKPSGISTIPYDDPNEDTMDLRVREFLAARNGARGVRPNVGIVHRIDKETSGLLVFTRTWVAKQTLSAQFRAHNVERRYIALVHGVPQVKTLESQLVEDRGDGLRGSIEHQVRRGHTPRGPRQVATTHIEVLDQFGGLCLVACRLETGRTHQIRIHLAEAGHPLVGERVYIRDYMRGLAQAPRLLLHAETLGFEHPTSGAMMRWTAEPPEDFKAALDTLRRGDRLSKNNDRGTQGHDPIDSPRAHSEAPKDGPPRSPRRQPASRNHPRPGGKTAR